MKKTLAILTTVLFAAPTGTGIIVSDPLFVDSINGDYHLTGFSPCIDVADSINAPDFDLDGNPRPQGAGYDIGAYEYVDPVAVHENISRDYNLLKIYPNPTYYATTISFTVSGKSKIELIVYNNSGQNIKTLINKELIKGKHSVVWDGTNNTGEPVCPGIYFCKLNINNKPVSTIKIMLLQ